MNTTQSSTAKILPTCSWNNPGANPYQGTPEQALANYKYPKYVQTALLEKIQKKDFKEVADITKYGIPGYSDLRNMHFGQETICNLVDKSMWPDSYKERGLVYCVDEYCVIMPTVCGNWSEITPGGGNKLEISGSNIVIDDNFAYTGNIPDLDIIPAITIDRIQGISETGQGFTYSTSEYSFYLAEPAIFVTGFGSLMPPSSGAGMVIPNLPGILPPGTEIENSYPPIVIPPVIPPIPEPGTYVMMVVGILAILIFKRTREAGQRMRNRFRGTKL